MGPAAAGAGSRDVLNGSVWECRSNEPEDGVDTAQASRDDRSWTAAAVPGTAAGALAGPRTVDVGGRRPSSSGRERLVVPVPVRRAGRSPRRPLATRPRRAGHRRRRLAQRRASAPLGEYVGCAPAPCRPARGAQHAPAPLRGPGSAARPTQAASPMAKPAPPLSEPALVPHDAARPRPGVGAEWGARGALAPGSSSSCRDRAVRGRAQRACHVRRGRRSRRGPPPARRCRGRN